MEDVGLGLVAMALEGLEEVLQVTDIAFAIYHQAGAGYL